MRPSFSAASRNSMAVKRKPETVRRIAIPPDTRPSPNRWKRTTPRIAKPRMPWRSGRYFRFGTCWCTRDNETVAVSDNNHQLLMRFTNIATPGLAAQLHSDENRFWDERDAPLFGHAVAHQRSNGRQVLGGGRTTVC